MESNIKEEILTLDNIKEKQEACIENWTFIIFDIFFPMFDTISEIKITRAGGLKRHVVPYFACKRSVTQFGP